MKMEGLKRWLSALLCACMIAAMAPSAGAVEDAVAQIGSVKFATLEEAVAAAKDGDTVTLLTDSVGAENRNLWVSKSITLDLDGHKITSAYQIALGTNNPDAVVTVKNGFLTGGTLVQVYPDQGKLIMNNVTIDSQTGSGAIATVESELELNNCKITAKKSGILDYSTNHKTVLNNCTISSEEEFAVYHNGSTGGFVLEAENCTLKSNAGAAVYLSGSAEVAEEAGKNQQASFTNCSLTGTTGIEGKYADIILDDCIVTATAQTPTFEQYNNGTTADGFSVVSTDNSMKPDSPAPTAIIKINGGTYTGLVGLSQLIDKTEYPDFKEAKYIISGGTFTTDVTQYCVSGKMAKQLDDDTLYSIVDIPNIDEGQIKNTVGEQQNNESSVGKGVAEGDKAAAEEVAKNVNAALSEAATTAASKEDIADTVDTLLKSKQITLTDGKINEDVTLEVQPYLDVTTEVYNIADQQLKLEITPKYDVVAYTEQMGEDAAVTVSEGNVMTVNTPTEVTITLPDDFVTSETQKIYVKHEKNGRTYLYNGTLTAPAEGQSQYILSFTSEHGFSPFTVTTSLPLATITKDGVTTAYDSLQDAANAAASGDEIVLNSGEKHTLKFTETKSVEVTNRTGNPITIVFNGENKTVEYAKTETFSYTKPSSGGSSSGGSGSGTTTYKVTVLSADNGNVNASPSNAAKGKTITITVTPDKGYELDTLTAADGSGKAVELTKKSDVTYTFTMPASSVKVSAVFAKRKQSFDDVKTGDWFAKAVDYAVDQGMMNGVGGNKFAPDAATTRGMIVTVLYRLEDEPSVGSVAFTDVHDGEYYAKAVAWASANGIVNGYGNGKFGPNDAITREQFAAILYRYAQYKGYDVSVGESTNILSYADAQSISEYAVPAFQWSCGAGVMNGSNGKLLPKANATRAQAAQLLMNFCENAAK